MARSVARDCRVFRVPKGMALSDEQLLLWNGKDVRDAEGEVFGRTLNARCLGGYVVVDIEEAGVINLGCCERCGVPAEEPANVHGRIKGEREARSIVVCLFCLELLTEDARTFWDKGWSDDYRRKQR